MSVRSLFGSVCAGVLLAASGAAASQETVNLRFASFLPATLPQTQTDQWIADEVTRRSGGKLKITVFAGGTLGKPTELLKLASEGGVQMATTAPTYFQSQLPFLSATNSLPLVFRDAQQVQKVLPALYADTPALQEELRNMNLQPVFWHATDPYFLVCRTPVRSLADLKGKRVRTWGSDLPRLLQASGAIPVNLLPGDLYEALQKGTVDCSPFSISPAVGLKLHEVAKYVSAMNVGSAGGWPIFFNKKAWDALSSENRKLILDVSREAAKFQMDRFTQSEADARKVMKAAGVEFIEFPDQAKLEAGAPDFIGEWAARMEKDGKGAQASAMARRWRELLKQP